jgi:hypothetical protein
MYSFFSTIVVMIQEHKPKCPPERKHQFDDVRPSQKKRSKEEKKKSANFSISSYEIHEYPTEMHTGPMQKSYKRHRNTITITIIQIHEGNCIVHRDKRGGQNLPKYACKPLLSRGGG